MGIVIKNLWRDTILNEKVYATFNRGEDLPALCYELLSEQKKTWKDLREGYESLKDVRERDLSCGGFSVRLQHNPRRIKSSMADVARKNEREWQCFLCLDRLPEDQKGILYRNNHLILCNPMPVFSPHFTISHSDHRLQAIAENIRTFLQLMSDFGPGWVVLYNGAKCGASAPDHLHFQVAPSGQMPIEKEMKDEKRLCLIKQVERTLLYRMRDLGREVVLLEGNDPIAMEDFLQSFLNALKKILHVNEEPMINIAGIYQERKWHLVIFLRRKHRPDAFFKEGDKRVVVSPGVIDMAGLLITPVERDFQRLTSSAVENIYREVSLEGEAVERAIGAMR